MPQTQQISTIKEYKPDDDTITIYKYKVRRQVKFLDDSSVLKRARTHSTYEKLNVGGFYLMKVGNKQDFYRVEELLEVYVVK